MNVRVIRNECGDPYLVRISLIELFGFALKLHVILRSDDDRALHDHPWSFVTLMLCGGYWEHSPNRNEMGEWDDTTATIKKWYGRYSFRFCRAPYPHRLELECGASAVTLVLMWPPFREWGFYGPKGWQKWHEYLNEKEEEC